ncbi:choice-of-anchor Q domain-containing protein [Viscerimonas tarda]
MKAIHILMMTVVLLSLPLSAQNRYFVKWNGSTNGQATNWDNASKDLQGIINKASAGDTVYVGIGTYEGSFYMKEGVTVLGGYTMNLIDTYRRVYPGDMTATSRRTILDGKGRQRVLTQTSNFTIPTYWEGFVIQNGKSSANIGPGSLVYSKDASKDIVGIVYKYDQDTRKGRMLSISGIKTQWGGYQEEIPTLPYIGAESEALSNTLGVQNTAAIVSALGETNMDFSSEDYAKNGNYAAKWCESISIGGYSDWYLPSAGEFGEIAAAKEALGNLVSFQNGYWTSTHLGDYLAWAYYFEDNKLHTALKYQQKNVRAIHEFELDEEPDDIYNAGGGVLLGKNGILRNSVVLNNESPSIGGGIFAGKGSTVSGCLVYGNKAQKEGSGIYASGDNTEGSATTIINNTIINNTGNYGFASDNAAAQLINSIVWGNKDSGSNASNMAAGAPVSYSCIENGPATNDNISESPLFINAGSSNFQPQDESPAVNAGNKDLFNTSLLGDKDVAGKARIAGKIDIGAYENQTNVSISEAYTAATGALSYYVKDAYLYLTGIQATGIKLYNLSGQLINNSASGSIYLPQRGAYIVKVTTGDKVYIQKINW